MRARFLEGMLRRKILALAFVVAGCAAGSSTGGAKSVAPSDRAEHPAAWYTLGAGRADFQKSEHEFQLAATDCTLACKALASLQRAADHLCAVADPDECTDARARADRARRAVETQCGGC